MYFLLFYLCTWKLPELTFIFKHIGGIKILYSKNNEQELQKMIQELDMDKMFELTLQMGT